MKKIENKIQNLINSFRKLVDYTNEEIDDELLAIEKAAEEILAARRKIREGRIAEQDEEKRQNPQSETKLVKKEK